MTLLIVEDSSEMRRLIRGTVCNASDVVYECGNGKDALENYQLHRPDWVSMDVEMPGLDGISATRQIKRAFPEARIIVVSQYNDPEMREEARRAGAIGYLLKDELLRLREILGKRSGQVE
jgi:two-component system response regulator DesR